MHLAFLNGSPIQNLHPLWKTWTSQSHWLNQQVNFKPRWENPLIVPDPHAVLLYFYSTCMNTGSTSLFMKKVLTQAFLCGICKFNCALKGSFRVLFPPQSQDLQERWIGNSKLSLGVNVSVDYCLSLCVVSVINWCLVRDVPCRHPKIHLLLSTIVSCRRPRVQKMGIGLLKNFNWILVYKCGDKCVQPPDHHLKMFVLVTLIHWFKIKHNNFLWFWISLLLHYQILAKLRVHGFRHEFMHEKLWIHSVINWWTISHSHGFRDFKPDFIMAHHIN